MLSTLPVLYCFADDLFAGFMDYFASFDFSVSGISIIECGTVEKDDNDVPFYLENPLQRELNVSKNVTAEGVEHFQRCCRDTVSALTGPSSHTRLCSISGLMTEDESQLQHNEQQQDNEQGHNEQGHSEQGHSADASRS